MVTVNKYNFKDFKTAEIETGMYLSFCLSEEDRKKLSKKFKEVGGSNVIFWYKFVLQNVSVSVDLK